MKTNMGLSYLLLSVEIEQTTHWKNMNLSHQTDLNYLLPLKHNLGENNKGADLSLSNQLMIDSK